MKLLDEKGLTTVWAAIKNTFTSKSDADGKYAKKADLADYARKNKLADELFITPNESQANFTLLDIDGIEICDSVLQRATSTQAGVMTSADKAKLDGIATGANNYILPTASVTTLGGIKTGFGTRKGIKWDVNVDEQGNAYTSIGGLYGNSKGKIESILIDGNNIYDTTTEYSHNRIRSGLPNKLYSFNFPSKSGTFALTSDIPDVSNIGKFNNVFFISDCVSGRINLLIPNGRKVNLDDIKNKEDIIIFAILIGQSNVTCSDGFLYNNEDDIYTQKTLSGPLLITSGGGIISVYSL